MKLTKKEQLEKRLARAIKYNNKKVAAWTLVELERLEVEIIEVKQPVIICEPISISEAMFQAMIAFANSEYERKKAEVAELDKIDSLPTNIVIKKLIPERHITATERKAIKLGVNSGLMAFATRNKYYEVLGKKDNYLLMDLTSKEIDWTGNRVEKTQRVKIEFICA